MSGLGPLMNGPYWRIGQNNRLHSEIYSLHIMRELTLHAIAMTDTTARQPILPRAA